MFLFPARIANISLCVQTMRGTGWATERKILIFQLHKKRKKCARPNQKQCWLVIDNFVFCFLFGSWCFFLLEYLKLGLWIGFCQVINLERPKKKRKNKSSRSGSMNRFICENIDNQNNWFRHIVQLFRTNIH